MTSPGIDVVDEVRGLLDEYEQYLSGKARGTIDAYLRTVRQLIAWLTRRSDSDGRFEPEQLTQRAVEQYLAHLEQEGLGLHHRARVRSTISNFARFLIEEKVLLRRNPTRGIDLPPCHSLLINNSHESSARSFARWLNRRRTYVFHSQRSERLT